MAKSRRAASPKSSGKTPKKASKKSTSKKVTAKKTASKKAAPKKAASKKAAPKKAASKKAASKKAAPKKAAPKKAAPKKAASKKAASKKAAPKKAASKKAASKKAAPKKAASKKAASKKAAPKKAASKKAAPKKAASKKAASKKAASKKAAPKKAASKKAASKKAAPKKAAAKRPVVTSTVDENFEAPNVKKTSKDEALLTVALDAHHTGLMAMKVAAHPDADLSIEQVAILHRKLVAERQRVIAGFDQHLTEALTEAGAMPDETDMAQRHTEQGFLIRFADKERKLLEEIERALRKLRESDYGVCEGTEESIGFKRLELRPWTRYSVAYKEHVEMERNQHRR